MITRLILKTSGASKNPSIPLILSTLSTLSGNNNTTIMANTTARNRKPVIGLHSRKVLCVAAAAALSTATPVHAFPMQGIANRHTTTSTTEHCHSRYFGSYSSVLSEATPCMVSTLTRSTAATTRLYSSSRMRNRFQNNNGDDDPNRKELFGFRRTAKKVAQKILPTKWFGSEKEKEALERKQEAKDRVQGELDQMLKGAPLPIKMFGKLVAGPLMGKIASTAVEASYQQAQTMEKILDEARSYLVNDPTTVDLLGMPIQIGQPYSQSSATTIINGKRQMRMDFAVEISGPKGSGMTRISATNEGIGQLLVEAMGRVYQIDLSSANKFSSSSSSSSNSFTNKSFGGKKKNNNDDDIIEAEIIDKETNR